MQGCDGLLTLYIQHEAPEGGIRANWIPAPSGPFFMAGRFYGPEASLIDGSYRNPECKRVILAIRHPIPKFPYPPFLL
jgi:hypothetical protein